MTGRRSVYRSGWQVAQQTSAQPDQQNAELEARRRQTVGAAVAEAPDDAFRAELAEVVAELAEPVLIGVELMVGDDVCVQLARRPVADEAAPRKQGLQ